MMNQRDKTAAVAMATVFTNDGVIPEVGVASCSSEFCLLETGDENAFFSLSRSQSSVRELRMPLQLN